MLRAGLSVPAPPLTPRHNRKWRGGAVPEDVRKDAERYHVLRCYKLRGWWPDELGKSPAGLLAFSSLTLSELDRVLDDMLGYLPSADANVRADYQSWRRATTLERIDAAICAAKGEQ